MPDLAQDNLEGDFITNAAGAEAKRLNDYFSSVQNTVKPPANPMVAEQGPDPTKTFGSQAIAAAKDIGRGLIEAPDRVLVGGRNAVEQTLGAIDSASNWLDQNVADLSHVISSKDTPIKSLQEEFNKLVPKGGDPASVTGGLIQSTAQFLLGFAMTRRALGVATGGATGPIAEPILAGALTNALVFDPHEQNLSNLLKDHLPASMQNKVFDYLAADPQDSEAEARLKKGLEGLGLGVIGEGLFRGIAAIKANRIEKGVQPGKFTAIRSAEQPTDRGGVSYDIMSKSGEPIGYAELTIEGDTAYVNLIDSYGANKIPLGTRETRDMVKKLVEDYPQVKYVSGERISGARQGAVAKSPTPDGETPLTVVPVSRFIQRPLGAAEEPIVTQLGHPDEPLIAKASSEQASAFLDSGQLPFKQPFQYNWSRFTSSNDIQQAVNDTAQIFSGKINEARRGKITDTELADLAEQLGTTPQDLLSRNRGAAMNAEQIIASKKVLEAATTKLTELARVARDSTNEADLFAFQQMLNVHAGIQAQFQGAASEAGRALRALQLPAGSIEKQIGQINEMLMQQGGPDKARSLAQAISEINDPAKIAEVARGSVGKRLTDAVIEAWYFSLLSGPQTHIVNFISNGLNTVWQIPERALAAQISALFQGGAGVQIGEATSMTYGMLGAMRDALRLAGKSILTGETSGLAKAETRVPAAITAEKFPIGKTIGGPLGGFVDSAIDGFGTFMRIPTRALMGADEFYKEIGRSMQSHALAYRKATQEGLTGDAFAARIYELMNHPSAAAVDSAQAFANDLTFTTQLGEWGRAVQHLTDKVPPLKFIAPFTRTPANLFKWTGRRSPLALLSTGIRRDIARGGPEASLALARITMGSGVAMVMADLAMRGYATGAGPVDPQLRTTWARTHQPFSVKVGDTWYSYNRLDPFGLLLGAAASYAEVAAYSDQDTLDNLAFAITAGTSRSVFNKTWLRGPAQFADAMTSGEQGKFDQFVRQFTGSLLVPAAVAQTARVLDPTWREVNSLMDAVRARTPGYSETLPASRNLWGQKTLLEGGLGPDLVSPIYKMQDRDRPIDTWMLDNKVNVSMPGKVQMGAELTPKQYERFVTLAGNEFKDPLTGLGAYDTMNAMIAGTHPQSGRWQLGTDGPQGGRALILGSVIGAFRKSAVAQLYQEDADFRARVNAAANEKASAYQQTIMEPRAGNVP